VTERHDAATHGQKDPFDPVDHVDWDLLYRTGNTPWDRGAAPPLLEFLRTHRITGEVLVPGCGAGHDVRALAAQGDDVTGLDLSPTALRIARAHAPAGSESYAEGDLFALPREWDERFDWVVEHTCFCAIPPAMRPDYAEAISRVLKPGGRFLAIFFLDPGVEQGPPHGATREEIAGLFDPDLELIEEWLPDKVFPGREGSEICQLRRRRIG
jgi:methyl halide transferase